MNNEEITNYYNKIIDYNNKIYEKYSEFITKSNNLKIESNNNFELQNSLELNKIMLQGYILDSDLCKSLKEIYDKNYSIDDLKKLFEQNMFKSNDINYKSYYLAIELYDLADKIEELIENKIEYEINFINIFDNKQERLNNINYYEKQNSDIKNELVKLIRSSNLSEEKIYNAILVLNDILDFFENGYPLINIEDF